MAKNNAYLIIDIGTGNARVALVRPDGEILSIKRENVQYETDPNYEDAIYFDPNVLWEQIKRLTSEVLLPNKDFQVKAITATSQREGIVLIDESGNS